MLFFKNKTRGTTTLKANIRMAFLPVFVGIVLLCSAFIAGNYFAAEETKAIGETVEISYEVATVIRGYQELIYKISQYIESPSAETWREKNQIYISVAEKFKHLKEVTKDSKILSEIEELETFDLPMMESFENEIKDASDKNDKIRAVGPLLTGYLPTINKLNGTLKQIDERAKADLQKQYDRTKEIQTTGSKVGISLSIGILLIALFTIRKATISIAAPLIQITDKLKESSESVSQISTDVSVFSSELAKSVTDQADSTTKTSSSLEELSGMVKNNTQNAGETNTLAHDVEEVSKTGEQSIKELLKSMDTILSFSKNIEHLVSVIGEIGSKTAIIDEIVFQTKLLSFNASVEAERAGEHGRGFAVVAQEVGNLARTSGSAAAEISTIVKSSIVNAKKIATENKTIIESGNRIANNTAKLLNEIHENASKMAISVTNILTASQEQSIGINQINDAVIQLDQANASNSNKANQAEEMSSLLSDETCKLDGIVEELNKMIHG